MLQLFIPETELYDEAREQFITVPAQTLELEHSLVSLSKWESMYNKSFIDGKHEKTFEESLDYVRCMTLTPNVDPLVYLAITPKMFREINEYIGRSMTATTFNDREPQRPSRERVTAEIIYYWMIALNIPFECQYWHLDRLLTLIKVCSIKNQPPKKNKGSKRSTMSRNASLNAARRKKYHTKG